MIATIAIIAQQQLVLVVITIAYLANDLHDGLGPGNVLVELDKVEAELGRGLSRLNESSPPLQLLGHRLDVLHNLLGVFADGFDQSRRVHRLVGLVEDGELFAGRKRVFEVAALDSLLQLDEPLFGHFERTFRGRVARVGCVRVGVGRGGLFFGARLLQIGTKYFVLEGVDLLEQLGMLAML